MAIGAIMRARQQRQRRAHPAAKRPTENDPTRALRADREAGLKARIAELEDALRARDDFLAIVAHELRNPMTPISAQVELLLAMVRREPEAVPDKIVQGLERLDHAIDAYLRRATLLLGVSRANSGDVALKAAELDLSALVRKVAQGAISAAERAGCRVHLNVQEGIIGTGDAAAIEQILENLLSNAIRYGAGRPVEIALVRADGMARLVVRDQGIGIAQSERAQIFQRFRKPGRSAANGGFGVGLWVIRRLVQLMRGAIDVSSSPGAGATFTVTLPLALPDKPMGDDNADGR
jgi:two-component system OmpR family sensor kinase